jgi:hypothetical protein
MTKTFFRVNEDHVSLVASGAVECRIDSEDLERVSQHNWYAATNRNSKNGNRQYISTRIGGKTVYLHRFIMNAPKGQDVDHINHDTLDNRKDNLRIVSPQENNCNRDGPFSTSKLDIRGVSIHKTNNHDQKRYYAFRCHIQQCKASKFFPLTAEGLEQARAFSDDHYAQILDRKYKPTTARQPASGVKGISIFQYKGEPINYHARCVVKGEKRSKTFPYSPEGLEAAKQTLQAWRSE